MSTPNSRRPSAPGISTPTSQSLRSSDNASSFSVEPKSEFLRNALEARRAKDTPTPSPVQAEARPTARRTVTSVTPASDPWLDQAQSEEEAPRVTPVRRARRPSEGAHPRMPTQRELQSETEALKNNMFNLNLKLELLKKQNNELKDALEAANQRIEDLEPLEEENYELRDDNNRLTLRMQDIQEENIELSDANAELLKIQDETIQNIEKQHTALDEAADMIFQLEKEKEELKRTNTQLSDQVATCQQYAPGVDGQSSDRYPGRIQSIDESRPSTSHFDSDYYSQPGSPQVKSKTSQDLQRCSERAKNFFEMNVNGKKSMQELKKRVSDASIKHKARPKSPVPEVPQIPADFSDASRASRPPKPALYTPPRHHRKVAPPAALDTLGVSPARPGTATPRTPTGPKEGLRRLFREGRVVERSRPSSSHQSPSTSKGSLHSDIASPSQMSASAILPRRSNSRFAPTSSSERLRVSSSEEVLTSTTAPSEVSLLPPPSVATEDLISEPDYKEKWWKDVRNVYGKNPNEILAMTSHNHVSSSSSTGGGKGSGKMQRDFFFNGAEDEDQFMQRAHGYMPGRKKK